MGRPAVGCVEVVVRWGDELLEVRHVRPRRATPRPIIRPLVVRRGGRLGCVIPAGARGVLVTRGVYRSFAKLEEERRLEPVPSSPGARLLILPEEGSVRIERGPLTYELRSVAAPPPPPRRRAPSASRLGWLAVSFALHAVLVTMFWLAPPRHDALALDRTALHPFPSVQTDGAPRPWLVPGWGGTGQQHEGDNGAMGRPEAPERRERYAAERKSAEPRVGRRGLREAIPTYGVIGAVRAGIGSWDAPTSPYGVDGTVGHDDMSALGALMGNQIGDAAGNGGLGMRGTGRGGGGTGSGTIGLGALGTIGLGALGTLGHGAGCDGPGCEHGSGYGRGAGGLGPRESGVPTMRCPVPCRADVHGALSREVIRRVVRRHVAEVRFCYERGLQDDPSLEGRVTVQWIVDVDGRVTSATVASSTLARASVEQCVVSAVRRWAFPASPDGSPTGVHYPFMLRAD